MSDQTRYVLQRAFRAERARAGLTQDALAEILGWSRVTIADVEAGKRRINADELPQVCAALGVGLDTLFHRAPAEERAAMGL